MKQVRRVEFVQTMRNACRECCNSWTAQWFLAISTYRDGDYPLKGELTEYWSLSVSGSWRVIFRFTGSDIELIDYLDYH